MSNIFTNLFKNIGHQEQAYYPEFKQDHRQDTGKGLIVMGYSAVYYDLHPKSRVNNFNNL
jgi:hypothetical protein